MRLIRFPSLIRKVRANLNSTQIPHDVRTYLPCLVLNTVTGLDIRPEWGPSKAAMTDMSATLGLL